MISILMEIHKIENKIGGVFETWMLPVATKSKLGNSQYKYHCQGHNDIALGVSWKGFMSMHSKYEVFISYGSNVMAKVKFFATGSQLDRPTDRHSYRQD